MPHKLIPDEENLSLSEQLDRLPESELVQKVRRDYHQTGTYCFEDLLQILGDFTRPVRVAAWGVDV